MTDHAPGAGNKAGVELYRSMLRIRLTEQRLKRLYDQGQVHGPCHLSDGHEAIAVGTAAVLQADDYSIGTYRGHHHVLARGASVEGVVAELLGKETGLCHGKGGSMHVTDVEHGYYGSYAIIGAQLPMACGLAWAAKLRGSGQITACFFGDGATNIGAFHEALNLAAVWELPVVFVCENNQYMEYTPIADVLPVTRPAADRAGSYGLEPLVVDGNDVEAVVDVVGKCVARARSGEGPSLVEAVTYRLGGHSAADPAAYRPAEEVARWRERDPLPRYREVLIERGATAEQLDALAAEAEREVAEAVRRAEDGPAPQVSSAWTDLWAGGGSSWRN